MSTRTQRDNKKQIAQHEEILKALVKLPGNSVCADCGASGPRWASHNLGVFLCIKCAGYHRRIGTHISKVKSINLDTWTPEQLENITKLGNNKVNAIYNSHPERHPPPTEERRLETYIRNKYEYKSFMSSEQRDTVGQEPVSRVSESKESRALAQLESMGFVDLNRNRQVLARTDMNVDAAVEILCSLPPSTKNDNSNITQLQSMGFNDIAKSKEALQKANGSVERAIEILLAERKKNESTKKKTDLDLLADDSFGDFNDFNDSGSQDLWNIPTKTSSNASKTAVAPSSFGSFPAPPGLQNQKAPTNNASKSNDENLEATFAGLDIHSPVNKSPQSFDKNSILSLYQQSAKPGPAQGAFGYGMPGNVQSPPAPSQQQQQQQSTDFGGFGSNDIMGLNFGGQPTQQTFASSPLQTRNSTATATATTTPPKLNSQNDKFSAFDSLNPLSSSSFLSGLSKKETNAGNSTMNSKSPSTNQSSGKKNSLLDEFDLLS
ncbi:Protein gts1 [Basidiobolus ranarum]|uniref:Protein gts1 n=1 Tax=Basidiobolus ranarum TaxID=34480 RepID=A0ABR2X4J4_9FUNG